MTGWICPGCGTCYAPWVRECGRCAPVGPRVEGPTEAQPWPIRAQDARVTHTVLGVPAPTTTTGSPRP